MSNLCVCHENEKCEWCRLSKQNDIYRGALEEIAHSDIDCASEYSKFAEITSKKALEVAK